MLEQALTNLIVCLMISQKLHIKVVQTSQHVAVILGRFDFSKNLFEMRLAKKSN